jgi:electron transfer flavoprotein alpha subunit
MSILVFVETTAGSIKKSSREAVSFAAGIGGEVTALVLGTADQDEMSSLGKNGAGKVLNTDGDFGSIQSAATAIAAVMKEQSANILILAKSSKADAIGARVSVKMNASMASNVVSLPDTSSGFVVKRSIFTGNAFAMMEMNGENKVLTISKNAIDLKEDGAPVAVETVAVTIPDADKKVKITGAEKAEGDILLSDAEIVVSGGRGLKGPENWGMIEELAKELGAATGCSKPVSDMDWRPHHEHVGQTGIKVSPNLYIAIGISGAIQHLAGVNSSKYIVVINKDEDAPFFKAADYGIVGDAFEVVPNLIEAVKASK